MYVMLIGAALFVATYLDTGVLSLAEAEGEFAMLS